jgi:four helix bundle protein
MSQKPDSPPPLQERLLDFGAAVVVAVDRLPDVRRWRTFASQLDRCGTAPAAHNAEARGAESPKDFVHKLHMALKELQETDVWLRMANKVERGVFPSALVAECNELIAIMVASVKTAKRRRREK